MKNCITSLTVCVIIVSFLFTAGCSKKDTAQSEPVQDYLNLQVGKYIVYRLDSTLWINFGQQDTVISYQAKDIVDGTVTDALGRPGVRIVRYLRGLNSTNENDWEPKLTYFVIPTTQTVEMIENNLRFVKLNDPLWDGHTWRGNGFLPTDCYSQFAFSNDGNMIDWDYTYEEVGSALHIGNTDYDNTITVLQADEEDNVNDPTSIGWKNYWVEKYQKGLGLVYKEVLMWEHQPPTSQSTTGYTTGFGIKLTILSHN